MNTNRLRAQHGAALVNLLLLICLAVLAAGAWFGWQQWQGWQARAASQAEQIDQLHNALSQLQAEREAQASRLDSLETQLAGAEKALADLRSGGQRDWLVNEAAALASLAQQRLLLTADIEAADRLLKAADQVLARADEPALLAARKALARDRQSLETARAVDTPALVLKLAALQERVAALTVTHVPQPSLASPPPVADDWWAQLLARLPVQVRHYDGGSVPLPLDESQASMLRLTLNALLEQAQLAMLQGRAEIYRKALAQARQMLGDWFAADHAVARELDRALAALEDAPVEQALPDIGAGLAALRQLQGDTP